MTTEGSLEELAPRLRIEHAVPVMALRADEVPERPGVYVWYHEGTAAFVGVAKDLRHRVITEHAARTTSVRSSALRRTPAQTLGFGAKAELRRGARLLSEREDAAVDEWLRSGRVAFAEVDQFEAAYALLTPLQTLYLGQSHKR